MSDLDTQIRNLVGELVNSAPVAPRLEDLQSLESRYVSPNSHRSSRPSAPWMAAIAVAGVLGLGAVTAVLLDHGQERANVSSTGASTATTGYSPSTTASSSTSDIAQAFLSQLQPGQRLTFRGLEVTVKTVTSLRVKEVHSSPYETFNALFGASPVTPFEVIQPFPSGLIIHQVYVELALGQFQVMPTGEQQSCLILVREVSAPFSLIAVAANIETSVPDWFNNLANKG